MTINRVQALAIALGLALVGIAAARGDLNGLRRSPEAVRTGAVDATTFMRDDARRDGRPVREDRRFRAPEGRG